MSERNEERTAMLAAVPVRDVAFEIAVLAKIEQRRFIRGMMRNLLAAACVTLLLGLLMPQLDFSGWSNALLAFGNNTLVAMALLSAAFAAWHYRPRADV